MYIYMCNHTGKLIHTPASSMAGLNTVVAAKPWHSPSDMFQSVLICDSPFNLHRITSVCHIKKRREGWQRDK